MPFISVAVKLHIIPTLGSLNVAKLTAHQLERLYAGKLKEGQAPASVARIHAVLHKALADAERLELVQRNVASLARAPRAEHKEMKTFTPEHAKLFLDSIRSEPLEAFCVLCERLGVPRIRLHDLRHTLATLLFVNRVPAKVVQEMLGHGDISMTLEVYSHVLPEMQAEAAESLDNLLGDKGQDKE